MKLYSTIRLYGIIFMMTLMSALASAQFVCYNGLTVTLNPVGEFTLFPSDLLAEGDLAGLDATLSQMLFTCDDIGTNEVVLEIYDGSDLIFSCISIIIVEDQINPSVICLMNNEVVLDASGEYFFSYQDIVLDASDACAIAQYSIDPVSVQCGDPNPIAVTVTVIDNGGNSTSCTTEVTWSDYPDPTQNLACNADLYLTLLPGDQYEVTAESFLEGGPYACPAYYVVEISENMVPRPDNIVTLADTNKVLVVSVTDPSTDNSCWGNLTVFSIGDCNDPFVVCDDMCRSTPIGDCASGHTDEDNVEWPCDIAIEVSCYAADVNPTPAFLLNGGYAEQEDAYPQIVDDECFLLSTNYGDITIPGDHMKTVQRTWTIMDWETMVPYTYTQIITVTANAVTVCDTLPWNAPAGDCDSGHTFDDDVEWPADITVSTVFISPDDLEQNPDVLIENVRPQLADSCGFLATNYNDIYDPINDTTVLVFRTWTLLDWGSGEVWDYTQHITVENVSGASLVCVTREDGEPIPGVTLAPGIVTDDTGCYSFDDPTGMVVTPLKDAPIQEGVNLLDKIMMMEGVLGISTLSYYQNKAADLSQNQTVSTLDIVLLDKLIDGTLVPAFDHNWMFFDQLTHAQSMDISNPFLPYHFIGVKMGDLDNSAPLNGFGGFDPIGLQCDDEILNKKEQYEVSFKLSEDTRLQGFTLRLENPQNTLNVSGITAEALPGFHMDSNVVIEPGAITINYIAPEEYLNYGIALPSGSILFNMEFSPTINTFLSQELVLSTDQENILRSLEDESGLEFTLDWENVIISSVIGIEDGQVIEFFPNPVTDEIQFKGLDQNQPGMIRVFDLLGRLHYQGPLAGQVSLGDLLPGMYYLNIMLDSGKIYTAPMTKM